VGQSRGHARNWRANASSAPVNVRVRRGDRACRAGPGRRAPGPRPADPAIETGDYPVLLLSTVDKAVAFASNVRRAEQTGAAGAYFAAKTALVGLLDYFRRYHQAGLGLLPVTLTDEYGQVIAQVDAALVEHRARHTPPQRSPWAFG
jgi:hypothetical protein